jgi:hypothetical protein
MKEAHDLLHPAVGLDHALIAIGGTDPDELVLSPNHQHLG